MNLNLPPAFASLAVAVTIAGLIFTAIVHIAFAVAVLIESKKLPGWKTWGPPPAIWMIATLIGGVFVAAAFWLVHFSKFSGRASDLTAASDPHGSTGR